MLLRDEGAAIAALIFTYVFGLTSSAKGSLIVVLFLYAGPGGEEPAPGRLAIFVEKDIGIVTPFVVGKELIPVFCFSGKTIGKRFGFQPLGICRQSLL